MIRPRTFNNKSIVDEYRQEVVQLAAGGTLLQRVAADRQAVREPGA